MTLSLVSSCAALASAAVLPLLFEFRDALALTRGQPATERRTPARLALLALELAVLLAWGVLRFGAHRDVALLPAHRAWTAPLGALLAIAGVSLAVMAKRALGAAFSVDFVVKERHALVTDGAYAVTRHPIYTGVLAFVAGWALAHDSLVTLAACVPLAVSFLTHTFIEERLFVAAFGDVYREYQSRTPRLLPRLWPR